MNLDNIEVDVHKLRTLRLGLLDGTTLTIKMSFDSIYDLLNADQKFISIHADNGTLCLVAKDKIVTASEEIL